MSRARSIAPSRGHLARLGPKLGQRLLAGGLGLFAAACGDDSSGGLVAGPAQPSALDVQVQVFGPRCAVSGCHVGASAPFGLDLGSVASSTANLVGVASSEVPSLLRVEPFDAAGSYLFMKLTGDPRILGDPMPLGGPPLSGADLALVESWIEEGAP